MLARFYPGTAACQQLFAVCTIHGGIAWVHSALVQALEIKAGESASEP
jgi:2-hydroxy-3-oxopropionate reductase